MTTGNRIAITGANGFLGSRLVHELESRGMGPVWPIFRRPGFGPGAVVGDIDGSTDWSQALEGVDVVIHLAGIGVDPSSDAELQLLRATNVDGTLRLARAAERAGVRRLVYLSTVKVLGEQTPDGRPFTNSTLPAPASPYPKSKRDTEIGLCDIAESSPLEVVMVRPPMVYGPRPVGNFSRLVGLVARGVPLPFGRVDNARSIISRSNLVDALIHCVDASVGNQAFLVSDGIDLSTAELVTLIAEGVKRPARLVPIPAGLMRWGAGLLGREEEARRLLGSLQLDIRDTADALGWTPPFDARDEVRSAARTIHAESGRASAGGSDPRKG